MVYYLLFAIFLNGQQFEFREIREFESQAKCNEALSAFTELRTSAPWAVTCIVEHRA